jgi:Fe-S-cluster containining protein
MNASPRQKPAEQAMAVERQAYRERLEVFLASRDAGSALTGDALRDGPTVASFVEIAAGLARYADEAQAVVTEAYHPRLHCRDNCWYCCCKPNVLASIPELVRILDRVESTFTDEAIAALRQRGRRYSAQMEGRPLDQPVNESVPCPLLVDGRCSVYDIRPLVCRGYNSTDVDACRKAHTNANALVPIFAMLKDVSDGATVGAGQRLKATGVTDAVVDLGSALDSALSGDRDFAESIVRGATDLHRAENDSYISELWSHVCEIARSVGMVAETQDDP